MDTLTSLKLPYSTSSANSQKNIIWKNYLREILPQIKDKKLDFYPITSLNQFIHIGIDLMINDDLVIKNVNYAITIF